MPDVPMSMPIYYGSLLTTWNGTAQICAVPQTVEKVQLMAGLIHLNLVK